MNAEILRRGRGDLTLAGFLAAACVVLALVAATWWLSVQQRRAADWVESSHRVLASIGRLRAALVDVQNGHRGFTIEGTEQALQPYRDGVAAVPVEVARLHALLQDHPEQQAGLAEVERVLPARLASAAQVVEARRSGGYEAARKIVDSGWPAEQMTLLRVALQRMEAEQEQLLHERLARHDQRLQWFWGSVGAVVVLLLATLAVLYQQVRRRRADQQRLFESEQRFHLMASSVVDYALLMLDAEGRVRSWNAGAGSITGYREADATGRDLSLFYPQEDAAAGQPARDLEAAREQGRCLQVGWRLRRDGTRFWATMALAAMREPNGRLLGFSVVLRDLSERRRAEEALHAEMQERVRIDEELQRLNASLEAQVAERTAALRQANDELRAAQLRLRDLSARLIDAQEQERRHIARELHDDTGQALTAIRLHLMEVLHGAEATARMPECVQIVDRAIAQIRGMALKLRPTMLDDLGLVDALDWALEQQAQAAGWEVALDADEIDRSLPPDVETACFRIAQEALTNAARHARATRVVVRLRLAGDALQLTVEDDGSGFDLARYRSPEERRRHFGLVSMTERAGLVGGTLEIDTGPGQGTRLRAVLPLATVVEEALA